jgi:hypothetical protein
MKVNFKLTRREGADGIHSTQDRFECCALESIVTKLGGSVQCAEFLDYLTN